MLTIRLPWTTPPLTLNQRWPHWAPKARKTAEVRRAAATLARAHTRYHGGEYDRAHVELWWHPKDRRTRDTDNPFPTLKACIDGLRDAEVLAADDCEHVTSKVVIAAVDKTDPRLELVVHEWNGEWT